MFFEERIPLLDGDGIDTKAILELGFENFSELRKTSEALKEKLPGHHFVQRIIISPDPDSYSIRKLSKSKLSKISFFYRFDYAITTKDKEIIDFFTQYKEHLTVGIPATEAEMVSWNVRK